VIVDKTGNVAFVSVQESTGEARDMAAVASEITGQLAP